MRRIVRILSVSIPYKDHTLINELWVSHNSFRDKYMLNLRLFSLYGEFLIFIPTFFGRHILV